MLKALKFKVKVEIACHAVHNLTEGNRIGPRFPQYKSSLNLIYNNKYYTCATVKVMAWGDVTQHCSEQQS